jgi:hypothetical protein
MGKESEESNRPVERIIIKCYVQILLLVKLLTEPLRDTRNSAAGESLNTTSLTYSCEQFLQLQSYDW